ncbi:hypothetical protein [Streptomyces sp. WELS2]|uniref:hypothetical protein n=1 Tax=Streptomyces sp. WELS2 TaxID=2749435 RepID=UPI002867EB8E|nr:hypothetical protein [Streptomyces sp. WELS2]
MSRPYEPYYLSYHSLTVRPLVLGPDNVPVIADEKQAEADPPLAVLSAMTHGRGPGATAILESLASAPRTIDSDSAAVFAQFVDSCLVDPQAKQMWRDLMTAVQYFWSHPLAEQVREEGREEGLQQGRLQDRQEMTLRVLEWRGIPVPDDVRERVMGREDLDQLEVWAQRAVHATDAAELFSDK